MDACFKFLSLWHLPHICSLWLGIGSIWYGRGSCIRLSALSASITWDHHDIAIVAIADLAIQALPPGVMPDQ